MPPPPTDFQRAGPVPGPIGRLASRLYSRVLARRNRAFDAGQGVVSLPIPVISVGNLSVGGTGKTPMVAHLCRLLLERGIRPCIAMRGYRSKNTTAAGSDEADAYRRDFGDLVDIVAQPDRAQGIRDLLKLSPTPPTTIVLDDGFQHRQIRRDLDIVLIDASRDPFADALLPAGWLREGPEALGRAACVVLTHTELSSTQKLASLRVQIAKVHGKQPIASTRHIWTALLDQSDRALPLDWLLGKAVLGVSAIGNPVGFEESLRTVLGRAANPPTLIRLPDHDPYRPRTIARIQLTARDINAAAIVVTDKDWSKLRHVAHADWPCPVVRPVLSLGFVDGRAELERLVLDTIARTSR